MQLFTFFSYYSSIRVDKYSALKLTQSYRGEIPFQIWKITSKELKELLISRDINELS